MSSRFSQDLNQLLERMTERSLSLGEILEETHDRSFSLIIALLVLPFLVPLPPGLTTIPATACLLLSGQMALGRKTPWLPQRIARFCFPTSVLNHLIAGLQKIIRLLEKVVRPRWSHISDHPSIWRFNGLCLSWLALLLMTPVPFTNQLFSGGMLLLAVATLEADGLVMCVSYGLTILVTLVFALILYLLWRSPELLQQLF